MPTTTLANIRSKVAKKLYAGRFPIVSTTTGDSDSTTVLTDSVLAPSAQTEDYVGAWVFVAEQPDAVDSTANINEGAQFSASDTTLTVTDGTLFTVGDGIQFGAGATPDAEVCRVTAVNVNDLTVVRGIQGTTATTHENADNVFIVGPAVGEIARVTNVSFSGSTSNLTLAPALSASLISGTNYELHYRFYPINVRDKANEILENIRRAIWLPLSLVTDGDMEATGTTDWTASGTGGDPTLAKNTSTVLFGRQSLSVTNDGSTTVGQAQSTALPLPPNTQVLVAAVAYITSGDSAKLTLAGSATSDGTYVEIDTAESAASGWVLFLFTATLTSTQEWVRVYLESQAASDVTYWNFVSVLPVQRRVYDYPSALEWSEDFDEVFYLPLDEALSATTDDNVYRIFNTTFKKWTSAEVLRDETAVVPYRFQLNRGNISRPLFVRGFIDYATLTDDTDTTTAPEDIIVDLTYADMMDAWAQEELADDKPELAVAKSAKAVQVRQMLAPRILHFFKQRGVVRGTKRR